MKKITIINVSMLLIIPLFFISCVTPSRLGISYKGEQIKATSNNMVDNPNIDLQVSPLSNQDNPYDIKKLKSNFIPYVNNNAALTELINNYPDVKIDMKVTPFEIKKRTWILDILFFYPGLGCMIPYTPWWGTVNLDAKLSITIPGKISNDFKFNSVMPFKINSYPYYKAGEILTKKYSVAYDSLFEKVSKYNFDEFIEKNNLTQKNEIATHADSASNVKQNINNKINNINNINNISLTQYDTITIIRKKYTLQGKPLNLKQLTELMKNFPDAYSEIKKANANSTALTIVAIALAVPTGIVCGISGVGIGGAAIAGFGIGVITYLPFIRPINKHVAKAVRLYNSHIIKP